MVRAFLDHKMVKRFFNNCDLNYCPRSVTLREGTLYRVIQPSKNTLATKYALILVSGMASGNMVKRSTQVGGTLILVTVGEVLQGRCGQHQNERQELDDKIAAMEYIWILARWNL